MARFHGEVGFLRMVERDPEEHPGVWDEVLTKRNYYGDVFGAGRHWENDGYLNEQLTITNRISIVADSFARQNMGMMKYVKYLGEKWKITNAEIQYPRIILTLGGIYNEPEDRPAPYA